MSCCFSLLLRCHPWITIMKIFHPVNQPHVLFFSVTASWFLFANLSGDTTNKQDLSLINATWACHIKRLCHLIYCFLWMCLSCLSWLSNIFICHYTWIWLLSLLWQLICLTTFALLSSKVWIWHVNEKDFEKEGICIVPYSKCFYSAYHIEFETACASF